MDEARKTDVRNKILAQIADEKINPGCNKREIEQAIDNLVAFRNVAANRAILDGALGPVNLPAHMKARVLAAVFAEEERDAREARRIEERNLPDAKNV